MGVTGDARRTPDSITFDRRATFKLRFIAEVVPQRPESYLRTIPSFSLYQVIDPKPLEIHNGNHLCGHPKYNRNIPLPRYMRSEEHTSELQSLMRISYDVSCLKQTKNITHNIT